MATTKKSVAFILILTLLFTLPGLNLPEKTYGARGDNKVVLDQLNPSATEVIITQKDGRIMASANEEIFTSGPASEGIVITTVQPSTKVAITVDGEGRTDKMDITLDNANLKYYDNAGSWRSIIKLENKANVELTLVGENTIERVDGGVGSSIEITSPEALLITGSGVLEAGGFGGAAGIGGNAGEGGGNITIAGSTSISAISEDGGAGIGGGRDGKGGGKNITITDSATVNATGGVGGAGIGGGKDGDNGEDITISDSATVNATGGASAAAIGGGYRGYGKRINILGGTVNVEGGDWGAGIGGGYHGSGESINIGGNANVNAIGREYGAGIGGGPGGNGIHIDIFGDARVTAKCTGAGQGAGIGGGSYLGNNNYWIPSNGSGKNIKIREHAKVNVSSQSGGACIGSGQSATASGIKIIDNAEVNARVGGNSTGIGGGTYGAAIDILISGSAIVKVVSNDNFAGSGIGVGAVGKKSSNIVISGNSSVSAIVCERGAGIGVGEYGTIAGITFSGNTEVYASATLSGAGIGAGRNGSVVGNNQSGDDYGIIIKDNANVTAFGGPYGAGIGTGAYGRKTDKIRIEGGFVTASGGAVKGADDIGGGTNAGRSKDFKIIGGSVHVVHDKWGTTLSGVDAGCLSHKVTVPALYKDTGKTLKGNKDFSIRFNKRTNRYVAKTVSEGVCEHGETFPSEAAAYVYLPSGSSIDATIGEYRYGYADVTSKPVLDTDNIILWDNIVKVTYDGNGADEISFTTASITYGAAFGELPVITKAGYHPNGSSGFYDSERITVTSTTAVHEKDAMTVKAYWQANNYTISFVSNGATELSMASKKAYYDSPYGNLALVTKPGYTFGGWYTSQDKEITKGSIVKTTSNHDLSAKWKGNKYNVKFIGNGATVISFDNAQVTFGDVYGDLPVVVRLGYIFNGWFDDFGNKITKDSLVSIVGNHNITARWSADSYSVTLDVNTGNKLPNNKITVTKDSTYGTLPTPTKKGHKFLGWFTAKSGGSKITSDSKVDIGGSHVLYAHWEANKYNVIFKANAKKVKKFKPKSKKVIYGTKFGKLPKPKKTGYKFKGWYTKKKGGAKITSKKKMAYDKNIKLYAHWSKNGKVTGCKSAYIRKGPGVSYEIIGYTKGKTKISVIKKVKNKTGNIWYKVKIGKTTGYIYSKYIIRS